MRFELRFVNQYWTLFDKFSYYPVEIFGLKVDAEAAVAYANDTFERNNKARRQ